MCGVARCQRCGRPTGKGCALQDEQTGPQWPALVSALASDKDVFVRMINGTHIDSLGPATISQWLAFLDIFVAHRVPTQPPGFDPLAEELYRLAVGAASEPRVQVFFGNGGRTTGGDR